MEGHRGLDVDEIYIAGIAREREIVAVWKERIESLEDIAVRVFVAGSGVELKPEPWSPTNIGKRVSIERGGGPCPDVFIRDLPGLAHGFEVPIEAAGRTGEINIKDVPPLVSADTGKLHVILGEPGIVARQGRRPKPTLDPEPTIREG